MSDWKDQRRKEMAETVFLNSEAEAVKAATQMAERASKTARGLLSQWKVARARQTGRPISDFPTVAILGGEPEEEL